jgi:hypothetical protein
MNVFNFVLNCILICILIKISLSIPYSFNTLNRRSDDVKEHVKPTVLKEAKRTVELHKRGGANGNSGTANNNNGGGNNNNNNNGANGNNNNNNNNNYNGNRNSNNNNNNNNSNGVPTQAVKDLTGFRGTDGGHMGAYHYQKGAGNAISGSNMGESVLGPLFGAP